MSERRINLIASYAKSGSNWARMVLENYLADGEAPVSIWHASRVFNGLPREAFEQVLKIPSRMLDERDIQRLLPAYYREAARAAEAPLYYKIHDANVPNQGEEALFDPERVNGAVYLVRHPCDVAVSYSHHFGYSHRRTIERMADPEAAFNLPRKAFNGLLPARSLSWSGHVESWLDERRFPVELIRYEELLAEPLAGFSRMIAAFFGEVDEARLAKAVKFSSLKELRRQEGAREGAFHAHQGGSFFRSGRAGGGKEELSDEQAAAIGRDHGAVMARLGYR